MSTVAERLSALGLVIDPMPEQPDASFVPAVRAGSLVFTSGQAPAHEGEFMLGVVGGDLTLEQGKKAARWCAINTLRALVSIGIDLEEVERIVKVTGMVNAAPDFKQIPPVIDGASELYLEVFGDAGRHARTAVGMTLPFGIAAELELVVELR